MRREFGETDGEDTRLVAPLPPYLFVHSLPCHFYLLLLPVTIADTQICSVTHPLYAAMHPLYAAMHSLHAAMHPLHATMHSLHAAMHSLHINIALTLAS